MKKIFIIILLFVTSQVHGLQPDTKSYFFADAVLWQIRAGSAENWGQIFPPSGSNQNIEILKVPFSWSPGVRLGAIHELKNYNWDFACYYTWYKTIGRSQAHATSGSISSPYLGNFFANNTNGGSLTANPRYAEANIKWKFLFNTLDFELRRSFEINRILSLRSFIGLKTGVINNHIKSYWHNPTNVSTFSTASEQLKNDFYGLGPVVGLDTTWTVPTDKEHTWKVFGNFSAALLWGHWRFADVYENNTPLKITVLTDSLNSAAPVTSMLIGLEWSRFFGKSKASIHFGYESQVWWNLMQYYVYNMGRLNNLMSMQGVVLGGKFNF